MNDSNPWENQLRSWTLRRPSAKLKERIFHAHAATGAAAMPVTEPHSSRPDESALRWPGWNWLCPALACLMLALATLERAQLPTPVKHGATNALFASLALSNQIFSAAQTNTASHDHNHWHVATFVSTKTGHSISSMGSLPVLNTNNLMFKQ